MLKATFEKEQGENEELIKNEALVMVPDSSAHSRACSVFRWQLLCSNWRQRTRMGTDDV